MTNRLKRLTKTKDKITKFEKEAQDFIENELDEADFNEVNEMYIKQKKFMIKSEITYKLKRFLNIVNFVNDDL